MSGAAWDPRNWTHERVAAECRKPYRAYHRALRARHIAYYAKHAEQRSLNEKRPFEARELAQAFPPGYEHLAKAESIEWHTHAKSAGSSQVLLLALLQPAIDNDPSLEWLREASGVFAQVGKLESSQFEVTVSPELLNESPRPTALDWLVTGDQAVLAVEAKFTEQGLGRCSCAGRHKGECSDAVLSRPYWDVAGEQLGWTRATEPKSCPVSLGYQAVRNVAAALALAGEHRMGAFGLFYDARNPYFAGAGEWPGWAGVLEAALANAPDVHYAAVSWQRLLAAAPVPDAVRLWAEEKHGLLAEDKSKLPVLCGFDGDGEVWVEVCETVPTEGDAVREVAKLDHGAETWVVVGTDWLSFSGSEWRECPDGAEDGRRFWHLQWSAGPAS
jgi:hypothetical protein